MSAFCCVDDQTERREFIDDYALIMSFLQL